MAADPRDLCTVQNVKDAFEPSITGAGRDPRIQTLITDASVAIMRELDRELTPRSPAVTRRFRVEPGGGDQGVVVDLAPYDLRAATTVTLHPEATSPTVLVAANGYTLEPVGAPQGSFTHLRISAMLPITSDFWVRFGYAQLDILGNWGIWDTAQVDPDVREACVLTVRAWMRQNPAAYQVDQGHGGAPVATGVPQTWEIPKAAMCKLTTLLRSGI